MKPLKQALVAKLTTTLSALLPDVPAGDLPRGVRHSVEDLADSILRWRASQQRPPRGLLNRAGSNESDALARLTAAPPIPRQKAFPLVRYALL